jgi:hypothetical protein
MGQGHYTLILQFGSIEKSLKGLIKTNVSKNQTLILNLGFVIRKKKVNKMHS